MPLRFYGGLEGSGKTCMLTRDAYMHHLSGGEVYAFPGYELREKTGEVLSKPFMPQDMVNYSEILKKRHVLIIFDEVTNWINNHNWQNKFADLTAAVMSQRRKLEVAIWMSGPIFYRLPPIVQEMIHEVVHCVDLHTLNHKWPRGEWCRYQKEDMRGLLSNPKHRFSKRRRFHMKPWYPFYETDMITEFVNQFMRLKFKGHVITFDENGSIVEPAGEIESDPATLDRYINQYQSAHQDKRVDKVKKTLLYLKNKGISIADSTLLCDILKVPHLIGRNGYGSIITSLGAVYNTQKKQYDLSAVK